MNLPTCKHCDRVLHAQCEGDCRNGRKPKDYEPYALAVGLWLLVLLAAACSSCAPPPAPLPAARTIEATSAVLRAAAERASNVATPARGLDATGVRELLAGFELDKGDIAAERARQQVRADYAEQDAAVLRKQNEQLRWQGVWIPMTVGGVSFVIGAGTGVLIKAIGDK